MKERRTLRRPVIVIALAVAAACDGAATPAPPVAGTSVPAIPVVQAPLAFVVHATRPPIDLAPATAEALLEGRIDDWKDLGEPSARLAIAASDGIGNQASALRRIGDAEAVRSVERDRDALAVVPAGAVRPTVRTLSVGGVHPLRDPAAYALKVPGPVPPPVVTVLVVGDVMMARRVGTSIERAGDDAAPFRHVARRLAVADVTVVNLESALSRDGAPIQGNESFAADPASIEGLRRSGVDVVSLANNHVGDFGPAALVRTVDLLRGVGFSTTGAGRDAAAAREPAILERNGVRVGILAFNAIGETPAAGPGRPGAVRLRMQPRLGPLSRTDLDRVLDDVGALRARAEAVVVYPHWGGNYTRLVHSDQRVVARALIDAGADLVAGTHSHWVGGLDAFGEGVVAYSLGNFVFDMDFSRETMEGIALEATFWGGELKAVDLLPLRIGEGFAPRFLSPAAGRSILDRVWSASRGPFSAGS